MESELVIFNVEEEAPVTKTEREVELDEAKKRAPHLSEHFETVYRMEDFLKEDEPPDSNILQILCSYVMAYHSPIVGEESYSIIVREISRPTKIFDNTIGNYRVAVPGKKLNVIGFRIDPTKNNTNLLDYQDFVKTDQLLLSGFYQTQSKTTRKFLRQRKGFATPGLPSIAGKEGNVIFVSEDDAREKLKAIIDYICYTISFYSGTSNAELEVKEEEIIKKKKKPIEKYSDTDEVAKVIENITGLDLGPTNFTATERLRQNKLLRAKELGDFLGVADVEFLAELKKFVEAEKEEESIRIKQKKNFSELYRQASLDFIARKKYGKDFSELKKRRRAEVELEFKARPPGTTEKTSAVHKKLLDLWGELRGALTENSKENLVSIIRKIDREISAEKIETKKGLLFQGVCTHVLDWGKTMARNFDSPNMHNIIREEMIKQYSRPETDDGFMCKFCGELIAAPESYGEARFFGGQKISHRIVEDPLRTQIWKEANYIVSAYIRSDTLISTKSLVSSLADGLRSIIGKKEALLSRSRTAKIETIRGTVSLYIAIYVYAALCAMMVASPGVMRFGRETSTNKKKKIGGRLKKKFGESILDESNPDENESYYKKTKKKIRTYKGGKTAKFDPADEKNLLRIALNLIVMSKEPLIHQLKNVNTDIVKHMFLREAYPWARSTIAGIKQEQEKKTDDSILVERRLLNNPLWYYTLQMNVEKSNRQILGASTNQIANADNVFEKVEPPSYPSIYLPESKLNNYKYLAYKAALEYEKRQIADRYHFPPSSDVVVFRKEFEQPLAELEKPIVDELLVSKLFPAKHLPFKEDLRNKLNRYKPEHLDLANFYCPDGKKHIVGSFVFTSSKDIEKSLKKLDIPFQLQGKNYVIAKDKIKLFLAARKTPEEEKLRRKTWASMKIIDEVCKLCDQNIRSASSGKTSDETLAPLFRKINEVNAFFEYFSGRCPEKGLHAFVDKGSEKVCEKCGKIEGVVSNKSPFYKKYIDEFRNVEKIKLDALKEVMRTKTLEPPPERKVEYDFTLAKTAEWSKASHKKYNVLVNIGLITKDIDYEDIESARIDPSGVDETTYGVAAFIRRGFLLEIIREYNLLLHLDIRELPKAMKDIIKSKTIDVSRLKKDLPKIDFLEREVMGFDRLDSKKYANFLLEYLAGFIMQLYGVEGDFAELAKNIADYFTASVIKKNKYYSRAENVFVKNWNERVNEDDSGASDQNYLSADEIVRTEESEQEGELGATNDIGDFDEAFDVENADDIWDRD
jgi:hypothetical protein